jgi:GNAT superfamily N-acetyltransferase
MIDKEVPHRTTIEVISATDLNSTEIDGFLDNVINVENSAWPVELRAPREKFASRLKIFAAGFLALKVDGAVKAVTTSQRCNYEPSDVEAHTWDDFTDFGTIEKTNKSNGNALYVVSVGVAADAQGRGLGAMLVEEQKKVAEKIGVGYLFLGARIPGYASYIKQHGEISVEDYLKQTTDMGESLDPEIRFYQRQGLMPAQIVPNFEPDDQSLDYGVVMLWKVPKIV